MLREVLRENLDHLLMLCEKIERAFQLVENQVVSREDIDEIRRLVHSLKGNLQAIGLNDDAEQAKKLEESIFQILDRNSEEAYIGKEHVQEWLKYLNEIIFSLKSYLF